MRTTNQECREFVQERKPFKASNLDGRQVGKLYVVYSYAWYPLFVYDTISCVWYENTTKYSVSTTRQKSNAHPMVKYIQGLSHEDIKELIYKLK